MAVAQVQRNSADWQDGTDLSAAFRWTARVTMHEGVANPFPQALNSDGSRSLMNRDQVHFCRFRASDRLEPDARDCHTLTGADAPDPTAWGLHGAIHRQCPHARCGMRLHSPHATVLAALAASRLPPVDQNWATFFNRHVVDNACGGQAFQQEGERCAALLSDPCNKVLVMGNHGIPVIGETAADTFNRLSCFERAAETCIRGAADRSLIALAVRRDLGKHSPGPEGLSQAGQAALGEITAILDGEGPDYAH